MRWATLGFSMRACGTVSRQKTATLAGERDQAIVAVGVAVHARKSKRKDAAAQERSELAPPSADAGRAQIRSTSCTPSTLASCRINVRSLPSLRWWFTPLSLN